MAIGLIYLAKLGNLIPAQVEDKINDDTQNGLSHSLYNI